MSWVKDKPQPLDLPKGLTLKRSGEAIETVKTQTTAISLLRKDLHREILLVSIDQDTHLTLTPESEASETFYIVSGALTCTLAGQLTTFKAYTSIVTRALKEPIMLLAKVPTTLLYITGKPQFQHISQNFTELRKLAVEVELKDGYTAEHCLRLQALSFQTGQALDLSAQNLWLLDYGSYLHDVGKLQVPLHILNKPGKLTPDEWEVIKKHPVFGREIVGNTFMKEAGKIIEQHHERLDGSGYPYGLTGDDILIEAAIVAVADTFDAMTSNRPYRDAVSSAQALAEIEKHAGIHYPKEVVRAFASIVKSVKR